MMLENKSINFMTKSLPTTMLKQMDALLIRAVHKL